MTYPEAADQSDEALHIFATQLQQHGLLTPARIITSTFLPMAFLGSQCALFVRPLLPFAQWRAYASALSEEANWNAFQQMLERLER